MKNNYDPVKVSTNSAKWFYIIAALSIINSILLYFNANIFFIFGLSTTQFVDGIVYGVTGFFSPLALIPNIIIAGLFVLFGFYASKLKKWAFITGIFFYGLDALLSLLAEDWSGIIFHIIVFIILINGLASLKKINKNLTPEGLTQDIGEKAAPESSPEIPEIIEGYKKLKRKQLISIFVLVFSMIALYQLTGNSSLNTLPRGIFLALFIILFITWIVSIVFSLKNWRCPACKEQLAKKFNHKSCPRCGVRLCERSVE